MSSPPVDPLLHALKAAVLHDDTSALGKLLVEHPELKAKLHEPLFNFDSPAIIHAHSRRMVDVLLDSGADINARSRWWAGGFGILDSASPELADYAIERGAVLDAHAAARLGMYDRLTELVAADPARVHARGGDGQTPLHFASTIDIARFLLEHGAEIDARDVDHESTPAQYMIRNRQPIARYLVERGCKTDILMAAALGNIERVRWFLDADPGSIRTTVSEQYFPKQDPRAGGTIYIWTLGANKTAHLIAREFGHDNVVRLLLERSPEELRLSIACELGDEETFKAMLARRPELIQTLTDDDRGKLPNAAQNNNVQAVRLMLVAGWPVDSRGQHGATALHWAAFHGNIEMVREILRFNPPLELADRDFKATPLGWATYGSEHGWRRQNGDYPAATELLCAAGANVPQNPSGTEAVKQVLRKYRSAPLPTPSLPGRG